MTGVYKQKQCQRCAGKGVQDTSGSKGHTRLQPGGRSGLSSAEVALAPSNHTLQHGFVMSGPCTSTQAGCISCLHPSDYVPQFCTAAPSLDWQWTICALQQDSATRVCKPGLSEGGNRGHTTSSKPCEAHEVQDRPAAVCLCVGHRQGSTSAVLERQL